MYVRKCRICKSKELKKIFSLGRQPLCNNLLSSPREKFPVYPLELVQCTHCSLIQLNYVVAREKMFDNYLYIPSISKTYLEHFKEMSDSLIKDFNIKKGDLVVDIGGSDGSLLEFFQKRGMRVVNLEPAKNIKSKVFKLNSYFNKKAIEIIIKKFGQAKLVAATNVFGHIDNLDEVISGLNLLLRKDGVFFAQFPNVENIFLENQFDTIYHEHLSYFTYEPLYHLFTNSPLEIIKIEDSKIHGGSMRLYVRKRVDRLSAFSKNVENIKRDLNDYLKKQKELGKKIAGFGAAGKGMVLLFHCGLNNKIIDYIADGTPYKQGKFTPGTLIPILEEKELIKNTPDILLILAWNFKEEIIAKVRRLLENTGKKITFVVPIPQVEIIQ